MSAPREPTPSIDERRGYVQSGHVKWGAPVKQPGLEGSQQNAPAHAEPAAGAVAFQASAATQGV
jgi:hypothetical protein